MVMMPILISLYTAVHYFPFREMDTFFGDPVVCRTVDVWFDNLNKNKITIL